MDSTFLKSLSPEDLLKKAPTYISILQKIISEQNETIKNQKLASQAVSLMNIAKLADKAIGFNFPTDEHFFDFLPSKDQIQKYVYAEMMTPIEEQIGYITLEYVLEEWVMYIRASDEHYVSLDIQPNDVKKLLEKLLENNLQISIGYDEDEHDLEVTIWDAVDKLETI